MLSSFSPYVPQGLMPQFAAQLPALQGAGFPQVSPGWPGQPGAYGLTAPFAPFAEVNPYAHVNAYLQTPFTPNQLLQNPLLPGTNAHNPYLAHNPFLNSGGHAGGYIPATQQIVPLLAQLAQQISFQSIVTQQLGMALHQLAQQVAAVSLQSQQALGIGAGQGSAPNPFAGVTPGGYGGFNPQAQPWWGGNRSQTIQ